MKSVNFQCAPLVKWALRRFPPSTNRVDSEERGNKVAGNTLAMSCLGDMALIVDGGKLWLGGSRNRDDW